MNINDETNVVEARRAKDQGLKFYHDGDYERAIKFLNISLRLHDDPDTRQNCIFFVICHCTFTHKFIDFSCCCIL